MKTPPASASKLRITLFLFAAAAGLVGRGVAANGMLSVEDFGSIQEALDRNPGKMLFVPSGDHVVSDAVRIKTDHSGLWGPGRIVQANPEAAIVELSGAADVQLRDLTLTRAEGKMESHKSGISVRKCSEVVLSAVRVIDNRANASAINASSCEGVQIRDCLVQNYSRIAIDDRRFTPTHTDYYLVGGYAFNCIDGTGISVGSSKGVLIQGNRVIETVMIPTPELKAKYKLGSFAAKGPEKGKLFPQKAWDEEYVNNWHQGSAIMLGSGDSEDQVQIIGNYVENAAQGLDIHADHVIVAQNIVNNAFMGMKAMHGSRNVIIIGNQFSKNDLWSIGLMPGTASNEALPAKDGKPAKAANGDGYTIVANNIISDFGYGNANWIWGVNKDGTIGGNAAAIRLDSKPNVDTVPVLQDVIIQGNVVYDTGRDKIVMGDKVEVQPPRYRYAVIMGTGPGAPKNIKFANNIFHPGTGGISNVPLDEASTAAP